MTALTVTRAPRGHYRFRHLAQMEWIKLRSLRSTWWTLALTALAAIAISVAVGINTKNPSEDLTNNALAGVSVGLLLIGVLGVLVMTSEYTSGMIRATLAAAPNRRLVLAAKAAVFGAVALARSARRPHSSRSSPAAPPCGTASLLPRSASRASCGRCCCPARASA